MRECEGFFEVIKLSIIKIKYFKLCHTNDKLREFQDTWNRPEIVLRVEDDELSALDNL